jgi:hypothetical protein
MERLQHILPDCMALPTAHGSPVSDLLLLATAGESSRVHSSRGSICTVKAFQFKHNQQSYVATPLGTFMMPDPACCNTMFMRNMTYLLPTWQPQQHGQALGETLVQEAALAPLTFCGTSRLPPATLAGSLPSSLHEAPLSLAPSVSRPNRSTWRVSCNTGKVVDSRQENKGGRGGGGVLEVVWQKAGWDGMGRVQHRHHPVTNVTPSQHLPLSLPRVCTSLNM